MLDSIVARLNAQPGATMAELAEAAGISRATLHRRFPSREHLLVHLAEDAAAAAEQAVAAARPADGPARAACERLIGALVPLGGRFAFLLREGAWLDEHPAVATRAAALATVVTDVVERGRRGGEFRLDMPASFQARAVLAVVFAAWEAVQAGELGGKEAPRVAVSTVLTGLTHG